MCPVVSSVPDGVSFICSWTTPTAIGCKASNPLNAHQNCMSTGPKQTFRGNDADVSNAMPAAPFPCSLTALFSRPHACRARPCR